MSWFERTFAGTLQPAEPTRAASAWPSAGESWVAKPGDKLAQHHTVLKPLGKGNFGQVYLCNYDLTNQQCAVKVLRQSRLNDPKSYSLLRQEGLQWAELGIHPNIVAVWNLGEHARMPCIIMEYLPDVQSLDAICAHRKGGLGWQLALWLGGQIACGLDHAWQTAHLLHRDIKPDNILVSLSSGTAKVTDFGLAIAQRAQSDRPDDVGGTPLYMAPELYDGGSPSAASDIYSFGVTVYELITGRWPFPGPPPQDVPDLAQRLRTAAAIDPSHYAPDMPKDFSKLVLACLAKAPNERPKSFHDVATQLDRIARRELGESFMESEPTVTLAESDRLTNLSSLHSQLGNGAESRKYAEQALRLAPKDAKPWVALGNALNLLGDPRGAIASFEKALACHPDKENEHAALGNMAQSLFAIGDEQGGRAWLQRAIHNAEADGRIGGLDNLSLYFPKMLAPADAIALCDRVIAANPSAAVTWNNRAIFCRQQQRYEEAAWSAEKALALNPLYAKAWTNLANAKLHLGKWEEVIEAAGRALEIDPKTGGAYLALMNAYRELGDESAARRIIEAGARSLPDHPQIRQAMDLYYRN